jgi:outer membrane protein
MKNTPLLLSIISLVLVAALGSAILVMYFTGKKSNAAVGEGTENVAQKGAVVYFNLDRVLQEYDMANDLRSVVQTKVQGITDEVNRRGNRLQSAVNTFQDKVNKGLMTSSVAQIQGDQLQQQKNEFDQYANQKQQEINEEQQVMLNQIGDAIKSFLTKYNEDKKYAMIIATQGDVLPSPVVIGDKSLDITDDILAGLNEEYVKNKGNKSDSKAAASDEKSDKKSK